MYADHHPLPWPTPNSLALITDTERRSLRPIGASVREAAQRTDLLLDDLRELPDVKIIQGVPAATADTPPIPHAVTAGPALILIESVFWLAGRYTMDDDHQIWCDGVYIGQSAGPLLSATLHWQRVLLAHYRVSAMIVVHAEEHVTLCPIDDQAVTWLLAEQVHAHLRARLAIYCHEDIK